MATTQTSQADLLAEISEVLAREAQLLDEHRYDEWIDLLADDYTYLIPQIVIGETDDVVGYDDHAYLVMDSKASMRHKLGRRASDHAWAMHPPSIEHRLVGSVQASMEGDSVRARSVVLVARSRVPDPLAVYPATRIDRLTRAEDGWRFSERIVHLGSEVPDAAQLGVIY